MPARLDYKALARDELGEMVAYIAKDSPAAALRLQDRARETVAGLLDRPEANRVLDFPELAGRKLRRAIIKDFPRHLLLYRYDGETVFILRAFHASQDWTKYLIE